MSTLKPMPVTESDNLVITRIFNVPLALVWQAWTNPGTFKKWWGYTDFTCPYCDMDLHEGGKYILCMRSPSGRDYWTAGIYKKITQMEQLVFTESFSDYRGDLVLPTHYGYGTNYPHEMLVTVNINAMGAKTRMNLTLAGITDPTVQNEIRENWKQMLERFAAILH